MRHIHEIPILKTPEEIDIMRSAGRIVAGALKIAGVMAVPGQTTRRIDEEVERFIRDSGAEPTFKGYPSVNKQVPPFPASICASVNEVVVHGIPDDRILKEGDILSVDVGVYWRGFCSDAAKTFAIGHISEKARRLMDTTEAALKAAVAVTKQGAGLKDIALAVETIARKNKFSVVRSFVGHGIGRSMHEAPQVPNYVEGLLETASGKTGLGRLRFSAGLVLAIEPMLTAGTEKVVTDRHNGWTVFTKDHSLAAHFEHTVAVTEQGPQILTLE